MSSNGGKRVGNCDVDNITFIKNAIEAVKQYNGFVIFGDSYTVETKELTKQISCLIEEYFLCEVDEVVSGKVEMCFTNGERFGLTITKY